MPATVMFTMVQTDGRYGKTRRNFVTLPLVSSLLDEPGSTAAGLKYLALEDEPAPAPEPRRSGNFGARPRRGNREVIPLDE